jgi:hypothetical protein
MFHGSPSHVEGWNIFETVILRQLLIIRLSTFNRWGLIPPGPPGKDHHHSQQNINNGHKKNLLVNQLQKAPYAKIIFSRSEALSLVCQTRWFVEANHRVALFVIFILGHSLWMSSEFSFQFASIPARPSTNFKNRVSLIEKISSHDA